MQQVIHIHPDAPPKPAVGSPCSGCGVCCATEPCPVGIVLSRRRHGACVALVWDDAQHRYLCGAMVRPEVHLRFAPRWLQRLFARWVARMIAAGRGCDSTLVVERTERSP